MDNKITPAYDFRQENIEMGNYKIINIKNRPELIENAAVWFQDKWRVPADEYRKVWKSLSRVLLQFRSGIW